MFNTRVRTLFVLFCFLFFSHLFIFLKKNTKQQLVIPNPVAFLLNVTSTVMFWMSACQSILCTVHLTWSLCSPAGSFVVCGCVVGWQCPPHLPTRTCLRILCVVSKCAWLTGRQSIQTKFLRKQKRTVGNAPSQFCHLSMCCYDVSVWLLQQVKFGVFRYT